MGQLNCKNCHDGFKKPALLIASWGNHDDDDRSGGEGGGGGVYSWRSDGRDASPGTTSTGSNGTHRSRASSGILYNDPQRSNRIKHKKRCVVLHAEFRDRQQHNQHHHQHHVMHVNAAESGGGILLAPPLATETLMEDTDNVFSGQHMGVVDAFATSAATSSNGKFNNNNGGRCGSLDSSSTIFEHNKMPQDNSVAAAAKNNTHDGNGGECANGDAKKMIDKKTPEENAFLDRALSDDDNFVFDGITDHMRRRLKDSMEKVEVPRGTLLIKKGDDPDYLYLVLEGEMAVYIDPTEYIDENAVEIGKHAPMDIALQRQASTSSFNSSSNHSPRPGTCKELTRQASSSNSNKRREFKQSYVLQLRKSLFVSSYGENGSSSSTNHHHPCVTAECSEERRDSLVGKVFSAVRESFGNSVGPALSGILEDAGSAAANDEEDERAATPDQLATFQALRGLKHERDLGRGDVFGELGLLYGCPRTASCLSATDCVLYRVDGELFRGILSSSNSDRARKRYTESRAAIEALYNLGVFAARDRAILQDMGSVLNPVTFDQDDLVIAKGAYTGMMFFVMAGKLIAHDIGTGDSRQADIELSEGGHFGAFNLVTGRRSNTNVTVLSPKARLMAVTRKDYMKRRESLEPLMKKLWLRSALLTIPTIAKSKLSPREINSLVLELESISLPVGNIAFEGDMRSAIFIVETGELQMSELTDSGGVVHTFHQQDYFGGRSLFNDNFYQRKSLQVRAVMPSECMMLSRRAIVSVVGDIKRLGKPMPPVSRKLIKNMKLGDLVLHRIIGVGNFGRVWLVQDKISSAVYALKVMDKKEIYKRKMTKGVTREKNVMASVEHPFISNLVSTFQDEQCLYMLMSYVQGGELFGLIYNISKSGYLSNDATAFYGACLVEALSHLHSRNICHRDLKPENVLINAAGYVVLIDFGFAKVVLDKTFTLCGSPEYMAPEILLGKGHSLGVDHWALGVLLYEMLVGQTPFIHVGATRVTLFRRICSGSFAFPNSSKHGIVVNDTAKKFIKGLLKKNCETRIGSSLKLGDEEIRKNAWFQGLLTEYQSAFLSQKVAPPWLPDIDDELDASYFASHDNVERELSTKEKGEALGNQSQSLFEDFGCDGTR